MKLPEQNDEAIENALRDLRPRPPRSRLRDRLDRSLPNPPFREAEAKATGPNLVQLFIRLAIPALALALLAAWWPAPVEHQPVPPFAVAQTAEPEVVFWPVETNQYVLASEELALLPGPDERPVQLMRVRLLDYELSRADDGSELFVTSEREQIIPVTLTVY